MTGDLIGFPPPPTLLVTDTADDTPGCCCRFSYFSVLNVAVWGRARFVRAAELKNSLQLQQHC